MASKIFRSREDFGCVKRFKRFTIVQSFGPLLLA